MSSGISKKAIIFMMATLEDINSREATECKNSKQQKKKHVETILKSKADEGSNSIGNKTKAKKGSQNSLEAPASTEDARRKTSSEVVPHNAPDTQNTHRDAGDSGGGRKKKSKKAMSPERLHQKKMKADNLMPKNIPLVLTAAKNGRVISHGEEPNLEEAALDKKNLCNSLGTFYSLAQNRYSTSA